MRIEAAEALKVGRVSRGQDGDVGLHEAGGEAGGGRGDLARADPEANVACVGPVDHGHRKAPLC